MFHCEFNAIRLLFIYLFSLVKNKRNKGETLKLGQMDEFQVLRYGCFIGLLNMKPIMIGICII